MYFDCVYPYKTTGAALLSEAVTALDRNIAPEELPPMATHHCTVYLADGKKEAISAAARRYGVEIPVIVGRLAYGKHQADRRGQASEPEIGKGLSETEGKRLHLVREVIRGLEQDRVVIGEASTGIGKSRILGQAARHLLADPQSRVCVAGPTLSVMVHLMREFREVDSSMAPALLMGRQQFVSVRRLKNLFDEFEDARDEEMLALREPVEAWLASGAAPRCEHTRALAEFAPGISHLMDDLLEISPRLNKAIVAMGRALPKDKAEEGFQEPAEPIIMRMREIAVASRLVVCSHTMMMLQSKLSSMNQVSFPYTHALIDEIHQLEGIAAGMESTELSLFSLRSCLRRQKLSRSPEAIRQVEYLMSYLDVSAMEEGRSITPEAFSKAVSCLVPVQKILLSARKETRPDDRQEREDLVTAIDNILGEETKRVSVSFSPIRRYPSLIAGPVSVGGRLGYLWKSLRGAVGLSGTIFLPGAHDQISCGYVCGILALPESRIRRVGPIEASWVKQSPTLYLPAPEAREALSYPLEEIRENVEGVRIDSLAYQNWIGAASSVLAEISATSTGGTLVLCTAFRDVANLAKNLSGLGERLIVQDKGVGIQAMRGKFIQAHREGKRPVLIATGAAWVGLDLRDPLAESAAADTLLTDLVILRVPIGMQRSSTFMARQQGIGWAAVLNEAAIMLRQGVGRLIRREGLENRRLWILDGRLESKPRFQYLTKVFRGYPKRKKIHITFAARATEPESSGGGALAQAVG